LPDTTDAWRAAHRSLGVDVAEGLKIARQTDDVGVPHRRQGLGVVHVARELNLFAKLQLLHQMPKLVEKRPVPNDGVTPIATASEVEQAHGLQIFVDSLETKQIPDANDMKIVVVTGGSRQRSEFFVDVFDVDTVVGKHDRDLSSFRKKTWSLSQNRRSVNEDCVDTGEKVGDGLTEDSAR
jgi:hypothetical protein